MAARLDIQVTRVTNTNHQCNPQPPKKFHSPILIRGGTPEGGAGVLYAAVVRVRGRALKTLIFINGFSCVVSTL